MSSGHLYRQLELSASAPKGDFDFGDVMMPERLRIVTLDFVLDVQHTLKVEIPPGGEKVQLVPGGMAGRAGCTRGVKPVAAVPRPDIQYLGLVAFQNATGMRVRHNCHTIASWMTPVTKDAVEFRSASACPMA